MTKMYVGGYQWFTVADVTNASGLCRSCHNK
jgi:hypothetical protein